ncbi:MAG: CPBP family intramembrane glutamic endopeptidase, partial [Marinirhabdus sp.]|nr:CPBP family intramembrane glutamic endopeptidase [Marinirhabdus sp.]
VYSALIFSFTHVFTIFRTMDISSTINQLVIAFVMGLLLGGLYVKIQNIYVLALAHMFFNLPGYFSEKAISVNATDFTEFTLLPFNLFQSIISLIGILVVYLPFVAFTWYLLRRMRKSNKPATGHVHIEHPFSIINKKS